MKAVNNCLAFNRSHVWALSTNRVNVCQSLENFWFHRLYCFDTGGLRKIESNQPTSEEEKFITIGVDQVSSLSKKLFSTQFFSHYPICYKHLIFNLQRMDFSLCSMSGRSGKNCDKSIHSNVVPLFRPILTPWPDLTPSQNGPGPI